MQKVSSIKPKHQTHSHVFEKRASDNSILPIDINDDNDDGG